jgi:hypothetical protein
MKATNVVDFNGEAAANVAYAELVSGGGAPATPAASRVRLWSASATDIAFVDSTGAVRQLAILAITRLDQLAAATSTLSSTVQNAAAISATSTAAADGSGATGTAGVAPLALAFAAGQNTTIATTGAGGAGAPWTVVLGAGGTAASAATSSTTGAGGAFSLTSGASPANATAAGTTRSGSSGRLSLIAGPTGFVSGGTTTNQSGSVGTTTGTTAGAILIGYSVATAVGTATSTNSANSVGGALGDIVIGSTGSGALLSTAGSAIAVDGTATGGSAGTVQLRAARGGFATTSGSGAATAGAGQDINLVGGAGGNSTSNSGASTSGRGGDVKLAGGGAGAAATTSGSTTTGRTGWICLETAPALKLLAAAPETPQSGYVALHTLTAAGGTFIYSKDSAGDVRRVRLALSALGARSTADLVKTSDTAWSTIAGLSLTLEANTDYLIRAAGVMDVGAGGTGRVRFAFSGTTTSGSTRGGAYDLLGNEASRMTNTFADELSATSFVGSGFLSHWWLEGTLRVGAAGGTLTVEGSQTSPDASATTFYANSTVLATILG